MLSVVYAECRVCLIVMLRVVKMSVILLNVVMLSVILLSVVAPWVGINQTFYANLNIRLIVRSP